MPDSAILLFGDTYTEPNALYKTSFLAPDPVIVVDTGSHVTLWVSRLEYERARSEATVDTVRCTADTGAEKLLEKAGSEAGMWPELLLQIAREHGVLSFRVGATFPALLADRMRAEGITIHPTAGLYQQQRRIKSSAELEKMTRVENAAMAAVRKAIEVISSSTIRDGLLFGANGPLSGDDLTLVVEQSLLEAGCGTAGSITCGGPESSNPHARSSPRLRAGLPIVLDIYPFDKQHRYWGDMTRTVVRGKPTPEAEKMWQAVLDAQMAGLAAVHPGANGRDIHRRCCEVLAQHGFHSPVPPYSNINSAASFIHGTGHGIGLQVHEFPRIADVDVELLEGDLITIEPGLYDPAVGGVRIEDLVLVTSDGHRNLTPMEKRLVAGA